MKVIKRDGREVAYDRKRVVYAIHKANNEVEKADKISEEKIYDIIASIENRKLESMAVEDIQDIIEQKLMEEGKGACEEIQYDRRFHPSSDQRGKLRAEDRKFQQKFDACIYSERLHCGGSIKRSHKESAASGEDRKSPRRRSHPFP